MDALYFVTCCVQEKQCVFGEIANHTMQLNSYGSMAQQQWEWLAHQYPYIVLHAFVVMPNHIHGILEINQESIAAGVKIKSLSELMGAYKTTSSKFIRATGLTDFAWQRSFYDHIIRHEKSYLHIKAYIEDNPSKWSEDMFYQQV